MAPPVGWSGVRWGGCQGSVSWWPHKCENATSLDCAVLAVFSFLYFLKNKILKIYVRFKKYFKNIHRSPSHRATGLKCNFFFQIHNEVPEKKGPVARWGGDRGLSPSPRARQGACRPPRATGVSPYKRSSPPLLSSFEPENSTKNPEKKRGVRRRKAAKPCRIQLLWSAG